MVKFFLILIALFLLMRFVNFSEHLNFSADQGKFSSKALEIWRDKKPTFVGPTFSFHIGERYVYQGPYIYYLQLLFLGLGGFDPIVSSVIFTIFASLMIIPLYIGARNLTNKNAALLITLIYIFFPYYIHYTRFLWNPNYQLVLLPPLIFLMGHFKKANSKLAFFLLSFLVGVLFQLHYQFFVAFVGIVIYYFGIKKIGWSYLGVFIVGVVTSFLPLIAYDLTHKFYNFQTLKFFIEKNEILYQNNKDSSSFAPHYYLALSFLTLLPATYFLRKAITRPVIVVIVLVSFGLSAFLYFPKPPGARGMSDNWNYLYEEKVNQIIIGEKLDSFNVVNLKYDTLSEVQKYLLKKDGIAINYDDYYSNEYLFVVTDREDYMNHPAYEIGSFKPSKVVRDWQINPQYKLILLERTAT